MIKIKVFNAIGPDLGGMADFLNEVGYENVKDLSLAQDGRGNLGGIIVYDDGKSEKDSD